MLIRYANKTDLADITFLISELGYEATETEVTHRLSTLDGNPDYHTIVVEMDNRVVGLLGLHIGLAYEFSGCYGRVVCLVVNHQYRKSGIGKRLIEKAKEIVTEQGGSTIVLNSGNRSEREDAHKFYLDNGFVSKSTGFVMKIQI
ncbi:GNAT family N-acetyltransferase [Psychrobacillus sp. NPDC093180]|uniref:GNAT family N-acetyltransferase n=1 Tax=Psychrobacillus sp. NPDC093180 TaxID=3364489 RepID=UPI0038028A4D